LKHDTLHIVDEDIIHENVDEHDDTIIELTIEDSTSNIGNLTNNAYGPVHEPYQTKKSWNFFTWLKLACCCCCTKRISRKAALLENQMLANKISEIQAFKKGIRELQILRRELLSLATLMTRYTIQMSSDDCGGVTEYIEFFLALRQVFRIRQQREELQEEIRDVLNLVESSYLEEQRKLAEIEKNKKQIEKKLEKGKKDEKDAKQKRFERVVAVLSIIFLPTILVAGVYGMNIPDLPRVQFWPLMGITIALSAMILGLFILSNIERKSREKKTT